MNVHVNPVVALALIVHVIVAHAVNNYNKL